MVDAVLGCPSVLQQLFARWRDALGGEAQYGGGVEGQIHGGGQHALLIAGCPEGVPAQKIGRGACGGRGGISVGGVSFKKKKKKETLPYVTCRGGHLIYEMQQHSAPVTGIFLCDELISAAQMTLLEYLLPTC